MCSAGSQTPDKCAGAAALQRPELSNANARCRPKELESIFNNLSVYCLIQLKRYKPGLNTRCLYLK